MGVHKSRPERRRIRLRATGEGLGKLVLSLLRTVSAQAGRSHCIILKPYSNASPHLTADSLRHTDPTLTLTRTLTAVSFIA